MPSGNATDRTRRRAQRQRHGPHPSSCPAATPRTAPVVVPGSNATDRAPGRSGRGRSRLWCSRAGAMRSQWTAGGSNTDRIGCCGQATSRPAVVCGSALVGRRQDLVPTRHRPGAGPGWNPGAGPVTDAGHLVTDCGSRPRDRSRNRSRDVVRVLVPSGTGWPRQEPVGSVMESRCWSRSGILARFRVDPGCWSGVGAVVDAGRCAGVERASQGTEERWRSRNCGTSEIRC